MTAGELHLHSAPPPIPSFHALAPSEVSSTRGCRVPGLMEAQRRAFRLVLGGVTPEDVKGECLWRLSEPERRRLDSIRVLRVAAS